MKLWSRFWKRSKKPSKQRKYRYNAPNNVRRKFMNAHLSAELAKKYKTRSAPVRVGDTVRVMRGDFKGRKGKVERVNTRKQRVYVEKVSIAKKDGTPVQRPLHPSNIMITSVAGDSKRFAKAKKQ